METNLNMKELFQKRFDVALVCLSKIPWTNTKCTITVHSHANDESVHVQELKSKENEH